MRGQDGFGVKLQTRQRVVLVSDGHYQAVHLGEYSQRGRQCHRHERMIPSDPHWVRQAFEDWMRLAADTRSLTVHRPRRGSYDSSHCYGERLVTEAHTEQSMATSDPADQFQAASCLFR